MEEKNEVEFKFLVENVFQIPCENVQSFLIHQTYLENDLEAERVRLKLDLKTNEKTFYHTIKTPAKEGSLEKEKVLKEEEYFDLLKRAKKNSSPISKIRHIFPYKERIMELDCFASPIQFTMLEVEVDSLSERVKLPQFINVVEDVTTMKEFSNSFIAKKPESTSRKIAKLFSKANIQYCK